MNTFVKCMTRSRRSVVRNLSMGLVRPRRFSTGFRTYAIGSFADPESPQPALYTFFNGDKAKNIFPPSEFESRIERVRSYMAANGIGASLFTSYHNICYLSGFLYCQLGRNFGFVVKQDDTKLISPAVDAAQPWRRCYGDNIIYTDWAKDNFFKGVSESIGLVDGKIGVEFDHVNLNNLQKLKTIFPSTEFVDIAEPSMRMRMVKSANEIEVIKGGSRICSIGGHAAIEALKEGVPEYKVALRATEAMVEEIGKTYPHADIMDTWTWCQSGINSDGAHSPLTARKIEKGDIIVLNCFPILQGYFAALERTLFFDHVSDEQLRIWQVNIDVHKRGLELIQPGAKCCDIALELNEIYREKDLLQYRTFGYGHSFGVISHYYGREAGLELREDIDTVLEPGMVLSMEPMVMIPEGQPGAGGYREHDILVVTEDGANNITDFPMGPEHNVIKK